MESRNCGSHHQRCSRGRSQLSHMAVVVLLAVGLATVVEAQRTQISCIDSTGRAQRCIPPFVNPAYGVGVDASNTCGMHEPAEYCLQTGVTGATKSCHVCDSSGNRTQRHLAGALTDFYNRERLTWWQSQTMLEDIQYPFSINLTLSLGKTFDITYVRLKFLSSRPESFAIYKRTTPDSPWVPYQYYSASCEDTYQKRNRDIITTQNEQLAICTDEFSDISPLTGGSVPFSTLEGRPSAYTFEDSAILQDWVTATDIRIVLNRINTFGDEVFGDPNVLKSYFYAISDFAVGGRCKCNGHASECVKSTGEGLAERIVCRCEHHTMGQDCDECMPFYNDRPWQRATAEEANECLACQCNSRSERCYFDEDLYRRTGHGGHCIDCRQNTFGINCERCKDYFYKSGGQCVACLCDATGSVSRQCDVTGGCQCKRGVTGPSCDRCAPNHYDFGQSGCRPCECLPAGSLDNEPVCLSDNGLCTCKEFVEGQNCDKCKPGYFSLDGGNAQGCIACFCYGHSSICSSATGYSVRVIQSKFNSGRQRWRGSSRDGEEVPLDYNGITQVIGISAPMSEPTYFEAPDRYLGEQRLAYDQALSFQLWTGGDRARASIIDVIIEGNGRQISAPIFAQGNPTPGTVKQDYRFRLNEHANYQWTPRLSANEFIQLLSNITAIRIRGTYSPRGVGFLDNVRLGSAQQGGGGAPARHVELCVCPQGYVGQFCESCAPGFHRDPPNGGPYARCVPCNCNKHSETCDVNTGRCICQHNTVGTHCERCVDGYYGYALAGTADDCQRCPCPDGGECVSLLSGDVACINCQEGYVGNRCEVCADGYYGDPQGLSGYKRPCQRCECNTNIDLNAVANCNGTTGECLKCIDNTGGFSCDQCLPGFYGEALGKPRSQCNACLCDPAGSMRSGDGAISCDPLTGQCPCQASVVGLRCDQCWEGYWNINSEQGCERCDCDQTGSLNRSCEVGGGQCLCRPGVTGRRCDECIPYYYGFSAEGCQPCNCDAAGSSNMQCDVATGACTCRRNIVGRMCDMCEENKYNITAGCIDCPVCYNLVQERVREHRLKLRQLKELIINIGKNPQAINDTDFRLKMAAVSRTVDSLLADARRTGGSGGTLGEQYEAMKAAIAEVRIECGRAGEAAASAAGIAAESGVDVSGAEAAITRADDALRRAEDYLETEGQEALRKANEAQRKYGQQSVRMTEIAREARREAERQEVEAVRIVDTANSALNTSTEALSVAQETLRMPSRVSDDLEGLRTGMSAVERLYDRTRGLAEQALEEATEAYKQSLHLFTAADNFILPKIDVDAITQSSEQIIEEGNEIKFEAKQMMEENSKLIDTMNEQMVEAEQILDRGIEAQQVADGLLADADAARALALEAIAKSEKTLRDAKEALSTLQSFDKKIDDSKSASQAALRMIPDIKEKIREAEDRTSDARNNLADAEADANAARDIASEAEDVAKMASEDAVVIREEAKQTKQRAMSLKDEADQLAADADDARQRLEGFEQQADEDARLAKQALEKADQARMSAVSSSQTVKSALDTVEDIINELGNVGSIEGGRLAELEQQLQEAEKRLLDADVESRFNELMASRQQQTHWVHDYTAELIQLRHDVDNVQRINATIPRGCFKAIVLEPTPGKD